MSSERFDRISNCIQENLYELSSTSHKPCIFKVHDSLRSQNEEAYEPKSISIGPYHHGKPKLKQMETHKLRYLQELLHLRGKENANEYIIAITELEDQARRCYGDEISLSDDEFVKMILLDGCFIIEFLRKCYNPLLRYRDDTIFEMGWLRGNILRDLILFENQIPFFVLIKLFDMTKFPDQQENLIDLALDLCPEMSESGPPVRNTGISAYEVIHLLDLVHKGLCSSFTTKLPKINPQPQQSDFSLEFINSTSELQQSGIKFGADMQNDSWLDITFRNGEIKIPQLIVDGHTEFIFRNLIAHEQYNSNPLSRACITDYRKFLDLLIDFPKDVEILRHCKIISNWLGDDEVVSTMVNKLGNGVELNGWTFCYKEVFKEVNKYSSKRRNKWRAHLMKNYFDTPWSIISFVAALVLLILTFVQTIFSILQYVNQ